MTRRTLLAAVLLAAAPLSAPWAFGAAMAQTEQSRDPMIWPRIASPYGIDPAMEARIDALVGQMSVDQKVGQIIQAEIQSISPRDIRDYHIGSVLNGGGSTPADARVFPLALWVAAANAFYDASMDTSKGGLAIPVIWGTDAVHGANNVRGATLFPHNIGLGAANDPALMRDIGVATAREIAVTGVDWTFAPTVAVAEDIRWGRSYESYSSDPAIVAALSKELILGLQGHPALGNALDPDKVVATAKHFIGDGGTVGGIDQGDNILREEDLFARHGQGYVQALGVGAQTVMASFNSWNGEKLHGNRYLLTDVLKDRMGFDGVVVGDWNGHGQIEGCTDSSCPQAIMAGVDLVMVPEKWRAFYQNTVRQVKTGEITMARLDDAVRRNLRVKMRAGMFEDGRPSQHPLAARAHLIGYQDHRDLARRAVRQSLVLLKNDGVLPIARTARLLVTGSGADSVPMQAGGWSITWQGGDTTNEDFQGATTIIEGFRQAMPDGMVVTDASGEDFDIAVVVFGETPYAEFEGDLKDAGLRYHDNADTRRLQALAKVGVPTVAVYLGGRPREMQSVIDGSDAFVAAWLPGSEGGGVADVLVDGGDAHQFTGKLPFPWPSDQPGTTRWPLGFGRTYE